VHEGPGATASTRSSYQIDGGRQDRSHRQRPHRPGDGCLRQRSCALRLPDEHGRPELRHRRQSFSRAPSAARSSPQFLHRRRRHSGRVCRQVGVTTGCAPACRTATSTPWSTPTACRRGTTSTSPPSPPCRRRPDTKEMGDYAVNTIQRQPALLPGTAPGASSRRSRPPRSATASAPRASTGPGTPAAGTTPPASRTAPLDQRQRAEVLAGDVHHRTFPYCPDLLSSSTTAL